MFINKFWPRIYFDKDEGGGAGQGAGKQAANGGASETGDDDFDKPRAMATIKKLREKEKAYEKLLAETEARKQADAEAEQTHLEEQGNFKGLYEKLQADYDKLKAESESGSAYQKAFQASLDARIALIPEDKRNLVPEGLDPIKLSEWLDKAAPVLTQTSGTAAPPPPANGKKPSPGNPGKVGRLSVDDIRKMSASDIAARWNDPEFRKDLADAQRQGG